MPVHKLEKHSDYDSISRSTVNLITDATALALWTYLITKPETWIPRESDIRNHFNFGHDKYRRAMSWLKKNGLAEWCITRGENGRITGKTLHIYSEPDGRLTHQQADPSASKQDYIENKHSLEKKELLETIQSSNKKQPPKTVDNISIVLMIIDYLNNKAGKRFKPTQANAKFIDARINEGFTAEDLKAVVDLKCSEWLSDKKFNQYLRPSTLFNAEKFNQYIGQIGAAAPSGRPEWMDRFINGEDEATEHNGFNGHQGKGDLVADYSVVATDDGIIF